jgi:nucleoside-diphosphate-sugar epimerase
VAAGRPTAGNPVIEAGQDADTNAAAPLEYVVDVVVGLYLLMRSNHREPLLIAGPARYPLSAVASELSRLVLRPLVTAPGGKPPFFLPPLTMTDDTRAALNWTPPTTLHAGLIEVLRSMSVPVEGNTP